MEAFGGEMVDRFGPLPDELQHLLDTVVIKVLCRRADVAKIETGPKGLVADFKRQGREARIRPGMKVAFFADWDGRRIAPKASPSFSGARRYRRAPESGLNAFAPALRAART
jgi:TRCF domain